MAFVDNFIHHYRPVDKFVILQPSSLQASRNANRLSEALMARIFLLSNVLHASLDNDYPLREDLHSRLSLLIKCNAITAAECRNILMVLQALAVLQEGAENILLQTETLARASALNDYLAEQFNSFKAE